MNDGFSQSSDLPESFLLFHLLQRYTTLKRFELIKFFYDYKYKVYRTNRGFGNELFSVKLQRFHFLERLGRGENIELLPKNKILKNFPINLTCLAFNLTQ